MAKSPVLFLVLVCASAMVGGVLQHNLLSTPTREAASANTLDAENLRQLTAIAEELRAIRARLDGPASASNPRDPAVPVASGDSTKELAQTVERLRAAVANTNVKLGSAPSALVVTRRTLTPPELLEFVKPLKDVQSSELQRPYVFLPSQEILNRFGPPTEITVNNGVQRWTYTSSQDYAPPWGELTFCIVDGFVYNVNVSYSE